LFKDFCESLHSCLDFRFFRPRRKGKLSPAFTYKVDGVIWRLLPTRSSELVGEERDLEWKKTSFFCLDQHTGRVLWQKVTVDESWWIGMETVHRDAFVLHSFATPELPIKKGIVVLDLATGKHLWTTRELTFVAAADESIFGLREAAQGNALVEMQYRSGALVQEWREEAGEKKAQEFRRQESSDETLTFPHPVSDLERSFPEIARFLQQKGTERSETVELLEHGASTLVFAVNERRPENAEGPGRMSTVLHVMEKTSGQLLLEERLNTNISTTNPDSSFIQNAMLYYVKELKELVAVKL
jgi:hypothetical protein